MEFCSVVDLVQVDIFDSVASEVYLPGSARVLQIHHQHRYNAFDIHGLCHNTHHQLMVSVWKVIVYRQLHPCDK